MHRGAILLSLAVGAVVAAAIAAGCSGSPSSPQATESAESTAAIACTSLSELACIDSPECTLSLVEGGRYTCGEPVSECEIGFIQHNASAERCAEGCTFVPAKCYCAPDVTCICGGGPPAQCVAAG